MRGRCLPGLPARIRRLPPLPLGTLNRFLRSPARPGAPHAPSHSALQLNRAPALFEFSALPPGTCDYIDELLHALLSQQRTGRLGFLLYWRLQPQCAHNHRT